MSIIIGIDHGYYAIKTAHCSFPAGLTSYGEHEPYTRQGLLEFDWCFFVAVFPQRCARIVEKMSAFVDKSQKDSVVFKKFSIPAVGFPHR